MKTFAVTLTLIAILGFLLIVGSVFAVISLAVVGLLGAFGVQVPFPAVFVLVGLVAYLGRRKVRKP